MADQRMVAFRSHTRGDVLIRKGVEFTVTEEEAHGYAARVDPLAGPLDVEEVAVAPRRKPAAKRKKAK